MMIRVDVSGAVDGRHSCIVTGSVEGISNNDILCALEDTICPDIESRYHVKCLYKGKRIDLHDTSLNAAFSTQRQNNVSVILTLRSDAEKLRAMKEIHARMPDMEYEFERERRRRDYGSLKRGTRVNTRVGALKPYEYRVDVYPGTDDAVKLLRMVVDDPGIRYLMDTYDWKIGMVSEMPPDGLVGISPVCILGVNIDCGREISLRLRTDDLKGFRKFDMIRSTMIHELAHMRYSEHDDDFKRFNRQLSDQAHRMMVPHRVSSRAVKTYHESSIQDTSSRKQPHTFSKEEWSRADSGPDARSAAGAAALRRNSSHQGPQSFPLETVDVFEKGQDVLYYNKMADTWQQARVISVDNSVQPPSYGIEMYALETTDNKQQEQPVQRETEASRLRKCDEHIRGINHDDRMTKKLEDQVATLLE